MQVHSRRIVVGAPRRLSKVIRDIAVPPQDRLTMFDGSIHFIEHRGRVSDASGHSYDSTCFDELSHDVSLSIRQLPRRCFDLEVHRHTSIHDHVIRQAGHHRFGPMHFEDKPATLFHHFLNCALNAGLRLNHLIPLGVD
jgi:hypothetical protein